MSDRKCFVKNFWTAGNRCILAWSSDSRKSTAKAMTSVAPAPSGEARFIFVIEKLKEVLMAQNTVGSRRPQSGIEFGLLRNSSILGLM